MRSALARWTVALLLATLAMAAALAEAGRVQAAPAAITGAR